MYFSMNVMILCLLITDYDFMIIDYFLFAFATRIGKSDVSFVVEQVRVQIPLIYGISFVF